MGEMYNFISFFISNYINFITHIFHPKSIKKLFFKSFLFLILLFCILFIGSSFYFSSIMRRQVYETMKETMNLYNEQLQQRFQETLTYLSENCLQNTDIAIMNTTSDLNERYVRIARLKKTLSTGTCSFSTIAGLFMYFSDSDIYIPQISNFCDSKQNSIKCSLLIQNMMRNYTQGESGSKLNQNSWFLLSENDHYFLTRVIRTRNVYAGAWIELDRLSASFKRFEDIGATILFADDKGNCVGNPSYHDIHLDPAASLNQISCYEDHSLQKYFTASVRLSSCDYYIMALIPFHYIHKKLTPLYRLMLFILLLLLFFCTITISSMNYFFDTPSRILNPVISSLQSGKFESKIATPCSFQEILIITDVFNNMINEIQNLRISIYEEQLAKKRADLQYLKAQLAPHFLINCLNIIFVLSQDPKNTKTTRKFIETLSEHLRYTLVTRNSASLKEELYYTKNYLQLTQLRFPNTLTYQIQVESSMIDAQVFPMLLLMLTDNSIKANVVMGEPFHIYIQGHWYEKDGQPRIHLSHIDSGTGFDEQSLALYNHITDYTEVQKNGYGIGIYNTVMRLRLMFGDMASIFFSNEPGLGARIDIDIPFISDPKTDAEQTNHLHTTR